MQRDPSQCPCPHLFAVDEGVASNCVLQDCVICRDIAKFDAEILKAHNTLVELSKQRSALKSQVNYHHKPLINRLPFELFSEIFTYVAEQYPYDSLSPWHRFVVPLRLGGVCQTWRDVTLEIPQLWTTVIFKVKSCGPPYEDVAKEWLNRSRSLPLSIEIVLRDCSSGYTTFEFSPSIDLIRSHSTRWHRVNIKCNDGYLLHQLLNNLQNNAPVDLESLSVRGSEDGLRKFDAGHVFLPRSIYQMDTRLGGVGLWDLPCGFERVTHLEILCASMEEVIYFIRNAANLIKCRVALNEEITDDDNILPLPTAPIVAQHLTFLETTFSTESDFFHYLTLPSLRTLHHEYYTIGEGDLEGLAACLGRSPPPFQDFNLKISIFSPDVDDWYELLPAITSLTVDMSDLYLPQSPIRCHTTEDFLAALARRSGTMVLPNLRDLCLFTRGMSEASWTSLYNVFQTPLESIVAGFQEQVDNTDAVEPSVSRNLLKKIEIVQTKNWERHFDMEQRVFERFEELKKAGVELIVSFSYRGPKFGESPSMSVITGA